MGSFPVLMGTYFIKTNIGSLELMRLYTLRVKSVSFGARVVYSMLSLLKILMVNDRCLNKIGWALTE
jgi:hypothetical protein